MEKILDEFGFSEYKKKAYLALLKLEKGSACEVAKKANIPSSKVYEVLSWLYAKGYVSIISEKPLLYKANNPKFILKSETKSKIERLKELEKEIDKKFIFPLEVADKSFFQIVKGRDPFFKKVKEAVENSDKKVIAVVKNWRTDKELLDLCSSFIQKGGSIRFLGPINEKNKINVQAFIDVGVQVKEFDPESTRFTVWDGKLVTIGFKENKKNYLSLWVENKYLGEILCSYFESLWNKKN